MLYLLGNAMLIVGVFTVRWPEWWILVGIYLAMDVVAKHYLRRVVSSTVSRVTSVLPRPDSCDMSRPASAHIAPTKRNHVPDYIPQYNPELKLIRFLRYLAQSSGPEKAAYPRWRTYEFYLYLIDRCDQDRARLGARAAAAQAKGHEMIAKWCLWREQSERKQAEFLRSRLADSSSPYYYTRADPDK